MILYGCECTLWYAIENKDNFDYEVVYRNSVIFCDKKFLRKQIIIIFGKEPKWRNSEFISRGK